MLEIIIHVLRNLNFNMNNLRVQQINYNAKNNNLNSKLQRFLT